MLEQDTSNAVPSPVSIEGKSSLDTDKKDPLRYTPSKRMFLGIDFPSPKKKDANCLKSNSKILKKKRHKDKLKLFKLDKLWDPTVQIPQLGKSAKYFKKKKKLAQVSGSQISGNEATRSAEKKDPILGFRLLMPLEYTFDTLSVTDTASLPPLVKELEVRASPGNDLLTNSSSLRQEIVPTPKVDVKSSSFWGDLIVLETPKRFKSKVGQYDDQLSEIPIGKIDKLDEVHNFRPQPPNLDSLLMVSGLSSLDVEDFKLMNTSDEVKNSEPGESDEQSALADLQEHNDAFCGEKSDFEVHHHYPNHSELSEHVPNTLWQGERFSPQTYNYFPGQNSPIAGVEKPTLVSQHPRQMLVDQLNKDPYPKAVREDAKIWVRRRAFSLNDAQIESLCKPLVTDDRKSHSEVSKAEGIANGEVSVNPIQKSNSPKETIKHLFSMSKDDTDIADHSKKCPKPIEMVSYDLSDSTKILAKSNVGNDYDKSSTNRQSAENRPILEGGSGLTVIAQVADMTVSKEESIGIVSRNSVGQPKECENVSGDMDTIVMRIALNLSSGTNTTPTERQTANSSRTALTCTEQVSERPEESKPSTSSTQELSNGGNNTILHGRVSSDLDTTLHSSQNVLQESADVETVGLFVNNELDDNDHNEISSKSISHETHVLSPLIGKELSEGLTPSVTSVTNLSKSDIDDNEGSCRQDKTSISLRTGLSSLKLSSSQSNLDSLESFSDNALVDISARSVSQSTGEDGFGDPEVIADLKEVTPVTPTGVNSRYVDSDDESNFGDQCCITPLEHWVLPPGKKFRRSLSIIRNLEQRPSPRRGRHYEISVEEIIKLQGNNAEARTPIQSLRERLSMRRSSWMRQITPPPVRRNTFLWSPKPADRGTLYETPHPRKSIYSTPLQKNLALRMSLRVSPIGPRKSLHPTNQNSTPSSPVQYTIRDLILTICKQTEPLSFSDILNEDSYEGGCKLGEGVFGEVFSINRDGQNAVLKIIPIEGQQLVNGEKQKTYQEVLSELVIAKVLDELRYEGSDELNLTRGYAELIATSLVQGTYPKTLLRFWEEFDQTKGSDNDSPKIFDDQQLFIVMEQGNGGKDLESYIFSSAKQSLSIFKQIAFSVAVAEQSVEFEHRDLHWGNVLVTKTSEKHISYILNGTQYSVASNGVKCTIIDYTLSRIKYINQFPIYNDIGKDPEMFIATGDYQFDIYRLMKEDVGDDWSRFVPKTNVRWLHYLLDKMITKVKYQRKTAKVHKDSFKMLEEIGSWVEYCDSAVSVALRLAESKN